MDYTFRKVDTSNINDVARVFNETRKSLVKPTFFLRNFFGQSSEGFIGYLAYDTFNHPVSQPGLLIVNLKIRQQVVKAALCVDAVTLLEHQKRGLFSLTMKKNLAEINPNLEIIFRLPKRFILERLIKKEGYCHIDDFYLFKLRVKPMLPLVKLFNRFNLIKTRNWLF